MQSVLEAIQPSKSCWLPRPSDFPPTPQSTRQFRRDRRLRVAIFDQQGFGSTTVESHCNLLRALDRKNLLAIVSLLSKDIIAHDTVKRNKAFLNECVSPDRMAVLGQVSPINVSGFLAEADVLLSNSFGEAACKSGTIMGALAGSCSVVLRDGRNATPLCVDEHFLASDDSPESIKRFEHITTDGQLDRIAKAGRLWYERNADWRIISEKYLELLDSTATFPAGGRTSRNHLLQFPLPAESLQSAAGSLSSIGGLARRH